MRRLLAIASGALLLAGSASVQASLLAAVTDGAFYTSSGNVVREYSAGGTVINSITGSSTTRSPALSFVAPLVTTVPEPDTVALAAVAALAAGMMRRRRATGR